jgi:hypothetical protein
MLTRLLTRVLLFLCALFLLQFTAVASPVAAAAVSDQLFFNILNPATGQFQTFMTVTLTEGASESQTFTIPAPPPINFLEPGNPSHTSDAIPPSISGTFTSDTEATPEPGGNEGPFTMFSISVNLANDMGMTNFGQMFSLTEAGERQNSTATVNVPGFHPMIPGDDVDISPFSFTFFSDPNEVGSEMEETFNGPVFTIVMQSHADVPEPATPVLVGGSLLLLGVISRRQSSLPRHRVTPSKALQPDRP